MAKVLYIKANAKNDAESRTFLISNKFIEVYQKHNPEDEVITLDLYKEDISFLYQDDIITVFGPKTEESKKHRILRFAYQFLEADKYVVAAPMWNLSIPAMLKAYIDYICVTGVTFKYTEEGPVGLCQGKKGIHIATRGGQYSEGPFAEYEMGHRYLTKIFSFLGIADFSGIFADELDVIGKDVDAILFAALKEAEEQAKSF